MAGPASMNQIKTLRWDPSRVSHLGCVKGCLDYLGKQISKGWLYGGTGHAFIINMHEAVCPSGPTAWSTRMLYRLGSNLGYVTEGVFALKQHEQFARRQEEAREMVVQAIDRGTPCYGWELDVPEYYVIYGYDDVGYYYSGPGCHDSPEPKPWQELGNTGIGILEVNTIRLGETADDMVVVREAIDFALQHAQNPENWIHPGYKAGLEGFDSWIRSTEAGTASRLGMGYNAAVWEECRRFAVDFLSEALERLPKALAPAFDDAIRHYSIVQEQLKRVSDLYPMSLREGQIKVGDRSRSAAQALRQAKEAEADGLEALARIAKNL